MQLNNNITTTAIAIVDKQNFNKHHLFFPTKVKIKYVKGKINKKWYRFFDPIQRKSLLQSLSTLRERKEIRIRTFFYRDSFYTQWDRRLKTNNKLELIVKNAYKRVKSPRDLKIYNVKTGKYSKKKKESYNFSPIYKKGGAVYRKRKTTALSKFSLRILHYIKLFTTNFSRTSINIRRRINHLKKSQRVKYLYHTNNYYKKRRKNLVLRKKKNRKKKKRFLKNFYKKPYKKKIWVYRRPPRWFNWNKWDLKKILDKVWNYRKILLLKKGGRRKTLIKHQLSALVRKNLNKFSFFKYIKRKKVVKKKSSLKKNRVKKSLRIIKKRYRHYKKKKRLIPNKIIRTLRLSASRNRWKFFRFFSHKRQQIRLTRKLQWAQRKGFYNFNNKIKPYYSLTIKIGKSNYFFTLSSSALKSLKKNTFKVFSSGKLKNVKTARQRRDMRTFNRIVVDIIYFCNDNNISYLSELKVKIPVKYKYSAIGRYSLKRLVRLFKYKSIKIGSLNFQLFRPHAKPLRLPKRKRK